MKSLFVIYVIAALLSVGCGDVNIVGPTQPAGSNCSLAGCAADQAPVEILD